MTAETTAGAQPGDTVFVIMPYRDPFLHVYEAAIRPAIERAELISVISREDLGPGHVMERVEESIDASALCIADLTGNNLNVSYEIGMAHSKRKPVILITQGELDDIFFDIRHYRIVRYTADEAGLEKLRDDLGRALSDAQDFPEPPTELQHDMLVPDSLAGGSAPFVVASSPLSYRTAFRTRGGWRDRPLGTYSDHIGIRGLMQAFGLIFGLDRLPELLDPDDFDEDALLETSSHLYSIGSPKSNDLTGIMMSRFFENRDTRWGFRVDPVTTTDLRNPSVSLWLNEGPYVPPSPPVGGRLEWDIGLVVRGPHPTDAGCMFMALAGRTSRGTEASCLAATDPVCLQRLSRELQLANIDLNNHRTAFCAVVSVRAENGDRRLGPDKQTFKVETVSTV